MNPKLNERFVSDMVKSGEIVIKRDGTVWKTKRKMRSRGAYKSIIPKRCERIVKKYFQVSIRTPSGPRNVMAHRVIWQFFNGDIPEGFQINHKNGNGLDNRIENLELATPRENILHAFHVINTRTCKGSNHSQNKLDEPEAMDVYKRRNSGEPLKNLAEEYGVSLATISNISKKKSWKHIHL